MFLVIICFLLVAINLVQVALLEYIHHDAVIIFPSVAVLVVSGACVLLYTAVNFSEARDTWKKADCKWSFGPNIC